jgi:hypothetical protein
MPTGDEAVANGISGLSLALDAVNNYATSSTAFKVAPMPIRLTVQGVGLLESTLLTTAQQGATDNLSAGRVAASIAGGVLGGLASLGTGPTAIVTSTFFAAAGSEFAVRAYDYFAANGIAGLQTDILSVGEAIGRVLLQTPPGFGTSTFSSNILMAAQQLHDLQRPSLITALNATNTPLGASLATSFSQTPLLNVGNIVIDPIQLGDLQPNFSHFSAPVGNGTTQTSQFFNINERGVTSANFTFDTSGNYIDSSFTSINGFAVNAQTNAFLKINGVTPAGLASGLNAGNLLDAAATPAVVRNFINLGADNALLNGPLLRNLTFAGNPNIPDVTGYAGDTLGGLADFSFNGTDAGGNTQKVTLVNGGSGGVAVSKQVYSPAGVKLQDAQLLQTHSGTILQAGQIGAIFGSTIGAYLGKGDVFASVAASATLAVMGRSLAQTIGTAWIPRNPRRIDGPAQIEEILRLAA